MSKVVLFGVGGGADTARRYLTLDSEHEVVAFTVDANRRDRSIHEGLPVVDFESVNEVYPPDTYKMFILLSFDGMNSLRIRKYEEAKAKGYSFVSYVASNLFHLEEMHVGQNCLILESQTINLDARIGDNVVMWSGNHIGDRSIVDNHVWISSQVAVGGDVTIGQGSFIGMNATIGHGVSIGENNFIGAGTLVTKCTKNNQVFVQPGTKALVGITSQNFSRVI